MYCFGKKKCAFYSKLAVYIQNFDKSLLSLNMVFYYVRLQSQPLYGAPGADRVMELARKPNSGCGGEPVF